MRKLSIALFLVIVCFCTSIPAHAMDMFSCPPGMIASKTQIFACDCAVSGASFKDGECTCPAGLTARDNVCQCPAGMVLHGTVCGCPDGMDQHGSTCSCPAGMIQNGNSCLCPDPMIRTGSTCTCPAGTTLVDGYCKPPFSGPCPLGFTVTSSGCACTPPKMVLANGACVAQTCSLSFASPQVVESTLVTRKIPEPLSLVDLNSDGKADITIADTAANNCFQFFNKGPLTQGSTTVFEAPVALLPTSVAADGHSQVAIDVKSFTSGLTKTVVFADVNFKPGATADSSGEFDIRVGKMVGKTATVQVAQGGNSVKAPLAVRLADFNANGSADVLLTLSTGLRVYLDITGSPAPPINIAFPISAPSIVPGVPQVIDIDGKGPKIYLPYLNSVWVYTFGSNFSTATGTWKELPLPAVSGGTAGTVTSGDIIPDGSRWIDLLATSSAGNLSLIANNNGAFTPFKNIPVTFPGGPTSVTVDDFNRDGSVDVASIGWHAHGNPSTDPRTSTPSQPNLAVLLGTGDPSSALASPVYLNVPCDATALATGDMDGDGFSDIVVGCGAGSSSPPGGIYIIYNRSICKTFSK